MESTNKTIIDKFDGEYAFLSNFFNSPITVGGLLCPTVEHAFQLCKTLSREERLDIANSSTPGIAKRKGRKATLRSNWEEVKDDVMELCLKKKFTEHLDLQEKLLATGNAFLVEGNTWNDTYWGVCGGIGQNKLGELLMKTREEIKKGLSSDCGGTNESIK